MVKVDGLSIREKRFVNAVEFPEMVTEDQEEQRKKADHH